MRSVYDTRIHSSYFPPSGTRLVPHRYEAILAHARTSLRPGSVPHVLEIGAESPLVANAVRSGLGLESGSYDVVDVSASSVQALSSAGVRVRQCDVSTDSLPFSDSTFSLVVMSEVLEHLIDPDHALDEVRRVMRGDGLLILTTPNLAAWFNRFLLAVGIQPVYTETGTQWVFGRRGILPRSRPVGHLRILTTQSTIELLTHHALEPTVVQGMAAEPSPGTGGVSRAVDRLMARFPHLAADVLVVARKGQG